MQHLLKGCEIMENECNERVGKGVNESEDTNGNASKNCVGGGKTKVGVGEKRKDGSGLMEIKGSVVGGPSKKSGRKGVKVLDNHLSYMQELVASGFGGAVEEKDDEDYNGDGLDDDDDDSDDDDVEYKVVEEEIQTEDEVDLEVEDKFNEARRRKGKKAKGNDGSPVKRVGKHHQEKKSKEAVMMRLLEAQQVVLRIVFSLN